MSAMGHVRGHLLRGLLLALPMVITIWLLRILFGLLTESVTPWVLAVLRGMGVHAIEGWHARAAVPVIGIVLTLLVIYLIGLIAANFAGRRLLDLIEAGILKIPLVKTIYGSSRQLLDAINVGNQGAFSRVVLVEYPRLGVWTLGFVTNENTSTLDTRNGAVPAVLVFFPTTPNPTSGWLAVVPCRDILDLDMTVEEGVKLVVSGGIVSPGRLESRIRRPEVSRAPLDLKPT